MTPLARPLARYPHARRAGSLLFLSGQAACGPDNSPCSGADGAGASAADVGTQTLTVLTNIERVLRAHDLNRRNLVDVTVFLTDSLAFDAMNRAWNEFFADVEPPARTTVIVDRLPGDIDSKAVEIKAVAMIGEL